MASRLRQIKERKLAVKAAETAVGVSSPAPAAVERKSPEQSAADMKLIQLTEHRKQLKAIQSVEKKIELKREILPEYRDWIMGLVEKPEALPEGKPQDVLTRVMLWLIDVGEIYDALRLGEVVIARSIPLPTGFNRDTACVLVEEIANAALAATRDDKPFDRDALDQVEELVGEADMPDEVKAKLFRARAELLQRDAVLLEKDGGEAADGPAGAYRSTLEAARANAQRALELDDDCGAKTIRRDLDRALNKLTPKET